jgi:hypothetical protein
MAQITVARATATEVLRMLAAAERYFTLRNEGAFTVITCALCDAFEMVVERSELGQKQARDRTMLHLRAAHSCPGC